MISLRSKCGLWPAGALLLLACQGPALRAQSGWISAPLMGFVADGATGEVRAIHGVLGSSTIGQAIPLRASVSKIYLAPGQGWGLAEEIAGRFRTPVVSLVSFTGASAGAVIRIPNALASPDLIGFSPDGRSAVLVSQAAHRLQVLTGLDATGSGVSIAWDADLAALGDLAAVTVNDGGSLAVALAKSGQIQLFSSHVSQRIGQAGSPAGIAFLPGQAAVAILDGAAASLTVIDSLEGTPAVRLIVPGPELAGEAALLQVSADGHQVIAAAKGGTDAVLFDLVHSTTRTLALPARATELEPLAGQNAYVFSANRGEAAWLLFADDSGLSAGFVQAVPGSLSLTDRPARAVRTAR